MATALSPTDAFVRLLKKRKLGALALPLVERERLINIRGEQFGLAARLGVTSAITDQLLDGELAPNHPYVPRVAEVLGIEPAALVATLAKRNKPMSDAQVKRLHTRFVDVPKHEDHGNGNGNGAAPKHAPPADDAEPARPATRRNAEPGSIGLSSAGRMIGLAWERAKGLAAGTGAPNDPYLALYGALTGMNVSRQSGAPMPTGTLYDRTAERAERLYRELIDEGGARTFWNRLNTSSNAALRERRAAAKAGEPPLPPGRPRTALKHEDKHLREVVRALVGTINMERMRGSDRMPSIPVNDMALVMADYLRLKGVKGSVIVSSDFEKVFG